MQVGGKLKWGWELLSLSLGWLWWLLGPNRLLPRTEIPRHTRGTSTQPVTYPTIGNARDASVIISEGSGVGTSDASGGSAMGEAVAIAGETGGVGEVVPGMAGGVIARIGGALLTCAVTRDTYMTAIVPPILASRRIPIPLTHTPPHIPHKHAPSLR